MSMEGATLRGAGRSSRLFLCVDELLLGVEEAAHAVERTGFAEDDEAFEQRWRHGATGDDRSEQHEVFFD